jgi:hypothetical protein
MRLRLPAPMPSVLDGLNLRFRAAARRRLEQDVVIGVRVKGRIEIDQVDAFRRDAFPEDGEIVAIVQRVGHRPPSDRRSSPSPLEVEAEHNPARGQDDGRENRRDDLNGYVEEPRVKIFLPEADAGPDWMQSNSCRPQGVCGVVGGPPSARRAPRRRPLELASKL